MRFYSNLQYKIFSLIIAFVLWFYAVGAQKSEITFDLDLNILLADNMRIFSSVPSYIPTTVRGQADRMMGLRDDQLKIKVDLTHSKPGKIVYSITSKNVVGGRDLEIVRFERNVIELEIDEYAEAVLPVEVVIEGSVEEGYLINSMTVNPSELLITGARSELIKLKTIKTSPLQLGAISSTVLSTLNLLPLSTKLGGGGTDLVSVEVEIYKLRELKNIGIVPENTDSEQKTIIFSPSVTNVTLRGPKESIDNLNIGDVKFFVDLAGIGKGEVDRYIQVLLPENVFLEKLAPERVTVIID